MNYTTFNSEEARKIFQDADVDRTGSLSFQQVTSKLHEMIGGHLSMKLFERHVESAYSALSLDRNSRVRVNDFIKIYEMQMKAKMPLSFAGSPKNETFGIAQRPPEGRGIHNRSAQAEWSFQKTQSRVDLTSEEREHATKLFNKYDMERSGTLSKSDVRKIFTDDLNIQTSSMSQKLFEKFFGSFLDEINGDRVQLAEYMKVYKLVHQQKNKVLASQYAQQPTVQASSGSRWPPSHRSHDNGSTVRDESRHGHTARVTEIGSVKGRWPPAQ